MMARLALLADVMVGMEIIYFAGGEYIPGISYHGVVTTVHDLQVQDGGVQCLPVNLDGERVPVRLFSSRTLFIVGS
jgi:hypothetical protein